MNGQYGSTGEPASRVASRAPRASTEPSPRPSKPGSMAVWVNATAPSLRRYSANPATWSSTSTSNRPDSGLSTTLGSVSVMVVPSSCERGSGSGGDGRGRLPREDPRGLGGGEPLTAGGAADRVAGAQLAGALEDHGAPRAERVLGRGPGRPHGACPCRRDGDQPAGEQGVVDFETARGRGYFRARRG